MARLNAWDVQTFRSLPDLADYTTDPGAEDRLLPKPAIDADMTPEMAMDWVEYVVPELRDSFARSLEKVMADLGTLAPEVDEERGEHGGEEPATAERDPDAATDAATGSGAGTELFGLTIPAAHAEDWFRAMNQARLVLSSRYGIDSEKLPDLAGLLAAGKLEHWFQYELFVSLQGWLVEAVLDP